MDKRKAHPKANPPLQPTTKRPITIVDCWRAVSEGLREDDPPEVKKYVALYERHRQEEERFEMKISPEDLSRLQKLSDGEQFDEYLGELEKLITRWMMEHPERESPEWIREFFEPNKARQKLLNKMAKPIEEGGLNISYPQQYPFGSYFLTVNILVQLFGLRPAVMYAVLGQVSELHQRAMKIAKERKPIFYEEENREEWDPMFYQGERYEEWESMFNKEKKYEEVVAYLSRVSAKTIKNLYAYLMVCLERYYYEALEDRRRSVSYDEYREDEKGDQINREDVLADLMLKTGRVWESSKIAEDTILLKEAKEKRDEFNKKFRSFFRALPQRQREVMTLEGLGVPQAKIADKVGVDIRTVKRDLHEVRGRFEVLRKEYEEFRFSDEPPNPTEYRLPPRKSSMKSSKKSQICPFCQTAFRESGPGGECPACGGKPPTT